MLNFSEIKLVSYYKVCADWRDIAITLRDSVFEEADEQLIDIHDVKVSTCEI